MNKLNAARVLMIASIVVIAAFQVYWLHKLFKDEFDSLKRTADIDFKESIYKLQVSRLDGDSLLGGLPPNDIFTKDMVRVMRLNKDSMHRSTKVFLSVSETRSKPGKDSIFATDSLPKILYRSSMDKNAVLKNMKFSYRLKDSLSLSSIDSAYGIALSKSGISLAFTVYATTLEDSTFKPGAFRTAKVPVGIFGQTCYIAAFAEPTSYIFKQISTQMFLSLLVVLLTVMSFVFIYRNLLSQKRLSDIKNEFISNITHELKTPIATVTVAIEAMKNFNALQNPERTKEYLDIADNELQRLSLLVDKVLKLSMFEQERLEMKFEQVDLRKLAEDIITSMKIQFEKHQASLELIAGDVEYTLHGDRLHLTSLIYNLLDNAIKYSPGKPVIEVKIEDIGRNIRLSVQDKGVGISSEYRDKIFDKFFRVPGGNRHNVKGYGLGLSYVSHIVAEHHGNIRVESEPGVGSTFIIDLPKTNEKG